MTAFFYSANTSPYRGLTASVVPFDSAKDISAVSTQIEQGVGNPSLSNFRTIICYYNISADSLLFPKDDDSNSIDNQIGRLVSRCNNAEKQFILAMITTLLTNNDDSLRNHSLPTLEELYAKAYAEIDYRESKSSKKR